METKKGNWRMEKEEKDKVFLGNSPAQNKDIFKN